jgi:hypothetical protein
VTDPAAELIIALATCLTAVSERARALREIDGWSPVSSDVTFGRSLHGHDVWVGGYVDGELQSYGRVSWNFGAYHRPAGGWDLSRSLDANVTSEQETLVELDDFFFDDGRALADKLPGLVDELLRIPAPEVAA